MKNKNTQASDKIKTGKDELIDNKEIKEVSRSSQIIRTGIVGIFSNLFLVVVKLIIGLMANSIVIILDAVNNATDAMSSIVTIAGIRMAAMEPDKKHPMGHGRIEYISAALISIIILYAGGSSMLTSIKRIIEPQKPNYTWITLVIVVIAVFCKLAMGIYTGKRGRELNSDALRASGKDALFDALISASTLAAALIYIFYEVSVEAWIGAVISLVILKSGIDMLRETNSRIVGERVESELMEGIKMTARQVKGVCGVHDLVMHNYGPDKVIGSLQIEVPEDMTAKKIMDITRRIERRVMSRYGVKVVAVGIDSCNAFDKEAMEFKDWIKRIVLSEQGVIEVHGFYLNRDTQEVFMDIVMDICLEEKKENYEAICEHLRERFPEYKWHITMDIDVDVEN